MSVPANLSRDFLHACQSGDLSRVETLVSRHGVVDWTVFRHETSGDTALHVAAREGHADIVRFLCEAFDRPEFKVDAANKDMKRPLHEAAQFARSGVLRYFISKGATVDALKRADWTPLMLACTKTGSEAGECVATLLRANANPSLRNKDGWSPFLIACRSGNEGVIDLLLNHSGGCIGERSSNGRGAMHIAAFHGHLRVIRLLAASEPRLLSARDSSGSTPLHEAVKGGGFNVANELVRLGADVRATDNVGQTILHVAAASGNAEAVEQILRNELIDVHAEALFGVTALQAARRGKQIGVIECLLKHGAAK